MNTKTEFKWFTIFDYEKEQEYLRDMHKRGWEVTRIGFPGFYHFRECTPEDVVYQLDYNQEGIANKQEYVQMFSDCGWKYLFDFVGYSYFKKAALEMDGQEEIFCDDESRLDMMKRVIKGRILMLFPMFLIILAQLVMQFLAHGNHDGGTKGLITLVSGVYLLYLGIFQITGGQYYAFAKRVHKDDQTLKWKYIGLSSVIIIMLLLFLVGAIIFWMH